MEIDENERLRKMYNMDSDNFDEVLEAVQLHIWDGYGRWYYEWSCPFEGCGYNLAEDGLGGLEEARVDVVAHLLEVHG